MVRSAMLIAVAALLALTMSSLPEAAQAVRLSASATTHASSLARSAHHLRLLSSVKGTGERYALVGDLKLQPTDPEPSKDKTPVSDDVETITKQGLHDTMDALTGAPISEVFKFGEKMTAVFDHHIRNTYMSLRFKRDALHEELLQCEGDQEVASCKGICGDVHVSGCFCDMGCHFEGDCCADYMDVCDTRQGSCEAFCTRKTTDPMHETGCYCDASCLESDDCCGDFHTHCPQPEDVDHWWSKLDDCVDCALKTAEAAAATTTAAPATTTAKPITTTTTTTTTAAPPTTEAPTEPVTAAPHKSDRDGRPVNVGGAHDNVISADEEVLTK